VLKISSFVLMLLMPSHAKDFQLHADVVVIPTEDFSFVLMLLRCQLRAEYFQPSADVDDAPALCCDVVVVDDAPTFVL
jgi:hypothetical protein